MRTLMFAKRIWNHVLYSTNLGVQLGERGLTVPWEGCQRSTRLKVHSLAQMYQNQLSGCSQNLTDSCPASKNSENERSKEGHVTMMVGPLVATKRRILIHSSALALGVDQFQPKGSCAKLCFRPRRTRDVESNFSSWDEKDDNPDTN